MTTTVDTRLSSLTPAVLSLFRIVFALLYLVHATQKLFAWPLGTPTDSGDFTGPAVPVGTWPYWWAGVIELVCGLLILTGLFTRIAAFIASGEMAFAYFMVHFPNGFWPLQNHGESPVLFCFIFLYLAAAGAGPASVDSMLARGRVRHDAHART